MEQAGELAATTAKLLNVSEFTSVDEATSALVSSLQAFTTEGQDVGQRAEEIVDILNHIGNRYPVATNELADGLATSSAALVAANNSIEEQVALLSAGNATMQDISTVASGLKIVAARLRGTTTDIDDDADSAITNVSKLQSKIKALTAEANGGEGINIINEKGEYKSTYEILTEISKIFDKMDDVSSASLLELIAGKNRSSVVAAILQNGDILEDAYADAFKADSSAQNELDNYLDSIQGRIDLFTNAVQTMWMNLLDTSAIKGAVDAGTFLIKQLDTLHGKIIAIVGALVIYKKFKDGVKFSDMFTGAADTIKEVYSSIKTMITATNAATKSDIARALASKGVNKELVAQIIAESGLKGVKTSLIETQVKATAATLSEAFANGKLTASQYLAAMSTMGLKTALQGLWNVLKANPMYAIAAVVAAAALAFDHFNTTTHEAAEAAKDAFEEIQSVVESTKSTIQELESELSTLQDKIEELDGKNLSFAEDQELIKLKKQREELEHSLKVQEQLLELQRDASNKQAVSSMKAYTKAASEGADETQETAKTWGTISGVVAGIAAAVGIIAAIPTGGLSLGAAAAGVGALGVAGGVAGNKIGEAVGSGVASNEGTYDSWYKTYTKALDAARKDEQEALKKYQKDSSNIDKLDKWQEAQQRTSEIEKEMYDHLSQMQQYMNSLEYGVSDEIDAELNAWNNFLDKLSIDQEASGAEVTALDRIFGENASEEVQTIKQQILDAVKSGKEFDFNSAINGSQELSDTLAYVGLNAENVRDYFTQIGEIPANIPTDSIDPVSTYSDLLDDAEAYKEILLQTSEIVVDNTKVTEDYKESLIALVGSEAEVNKYFDKNNKLIVKDAKGLNNLIKATRKNVAANSSLAKSQARLQYYELFKKMLNCIKAEGVVIAGKKQEILALYQEMSALEKTIAKYARLEAQLLDTNNAYNEFEKAQEIDSTTDYIGSVETWISALGEAFNTAELGTETAQVAIAGLVPESVYEDLDTVDEKMAAIYSYFKTGKLAQYFDIQFDEDGNIESAEMKLGNLRKFIEDGLANGTFVGADWQHFDLSEDIDSLEKFKDAMGVTEEVAFAFIESFEDHDIEWLNGDYSSMFEDILPDNLANDIYENTSALADLASQLANGEITAEEYTSQWNELSKASQENAQKARENASAWIEASNDVDEAKNKVQTLADELDTLYEQGASEAEIKLKTEELETAKQDLTKTVEKLSELETMDPVVLQVALDHAQAEIDAFEKENDTLLAKVEIVQDTENGEFNYDVKAGIELDESEKKELEGYLEDLNAKYNFEGALGDEVVTYEDQLQSIEDILQNIYDRMSGRDPSDTKTTNDADGATESVNTNGFKEFFTTTLPEEMKELWGTIDTFFTETIPDKWNEFWEKVGKKFDEIKEKADILKEKVTDFFTTTVPEKWEGFWEEVGKKVGEIKKFAGELQEKVNIFFTETLPKKWDEFWGEVDKFLFQTIPYTISYSAGAISRFFTETIPQKWDEFWAAVRTKFDEVKANAEILKEKVVTFFTVTIPQKWNEFWDYLGVKMDELKADAEVLKEKVVTFFTTTIPEKWNAFWDEVGVKLEELKEKAQILKTKLTDFFTVAIPQKWNEFWDGVGTFLTDTIPTALETIKTNITTLFTVTIPNALNNLWDGITTWISEKAATIWSNLTAGYSAGKSGKKYNPGASGAQNVNGTAHVHGTAHKSGDWGLPTNEHDSLVGEIGPEMVVDPSTGKYYTVGDNGAEMVDLPKGAIIFNHKQTESLLKNGYVASRGKAYADGNAHVTIWPNGSSKTQWEGTGYSGPDDPTWDMAEALANTEALSDAMSDAADSVGEFEETIDWIEIRMEEFDERIGMLSAELENLTTAAEKNAKIDEIIAVNQKKQADAEAGAKYYEEYAQKYLAGMNSTLVEAAKNGAIAITEFTKEQDEATVEAIKNYRDYAQKSADLYQQAEEIITEIADIAKQAFDNIVNEFENNISLNDSKLDRYDAHNSLLETDKGWASEDIYVKMQKENAAKIEILKQQRNALQAELDTGKIKKGTDAWYEAVNAIAEVDTEIVNLNTEIEDLQDSINDLNWEQFEFLITQFQAVSDEAENLIDILATKDAVDEVGNWTNDGITSLGLLAQQMEVAEKQASKYEAAIKYLNENWEKLGYTQTEYVERLEELKSGQYDAIKSYNDAKESIRDLNETRIDAIKDGIEKEIDAYEELIKTKKEALDAEKDLYDFQKNVADQQKNIADIQRKLAALSGDNSASARAQRAKLEAELYEAQADLEETYYDRSISNQQEALDKELESFQDQKEEEIEGWEKYLENLEIVVADSLAVVQENTSAVLATLTAMQDQYGLAITNSLLAPWKAGETAIQEYGTKLNISLTTLAAMFGLTVDDFAAKLGLTTEQLVSNLDITVAQMAESLGLTNEQLAAKLGLTVANLNGMMDMTIQQLAANLGITLPVLAEKLGTTTAGLAGNLNMTMAQFAGSMGLTVEELAGKFGLTTSDLAQKLGMTYQNLMNPFGLSMSATVDALAALEQKYKAILDSINADSQATVDEVNKAMNRYQETQKVQNNVGDKKETTSNNAKPVRSDQEYYGVALAIWEGNHGWGTGATRIKNLIAKGFDANRVQGIVNEMGKQGDIHSSKWRGKYHGIKDLAPYHINKFAKGTNSASKDQWAIIDELGDELQLIPGKNGRLEYIKKGTGIVPSDLTRRLVDMAMDPQGMLDRNRPVIGAPHIINNEINIDCSVGTMVNIEHCDQSTLPDVEKLVNKAFDKHMQTLNSAIRSKVR